MNRRFLKLSLLGLFLVISLIILSYFHRLGLSHNWSILDSSPSISQIRRFMISQNGEQIAWIDSDYSLIFVYDLKKHGGTTVLDPRPCSKVQPVGFYQKNLLVIRDIQESTFIETIPRGFRRFWGLPPSESISTAVEGRKRQAVLELVDIESGSVLASEAGLPVGVHQMNQEPSDFELGAVTFSPNRDQISWWRMISRYDEIEDVDVVQEEFKVIKLGKEFVPVFKQILESDGTLRIRSRLLRSMGRPLWFSEENVLFLSYFDAGSLIPCDLASGSLEATLGLPDLLRTAGPAAGWPVYDPELIETITLPDTSSRGLVVVYQNENTLRFYVLDSDFKYINHREINMPGLKLSESVWLDRSERLLVEDSNSMSFLAFSPIEKPVVRYPLPSDWGPSFHIVGEDWQHNLIGESQGRFLLTSPDSAVWETITIYDAVESRNE